MLLSAAVRVQQQRPAWLPTMLPPCGSLQYAKCEQHRQLLACRADGDVPVLEEAQQHLRHWPAQAEQGHERAALRTPALTRAGLARWPFRGCLLRAPLLQLGPPQEAIAEPKLERGCQQEAEVEGVVGIANSQSTNRVPSAAPANAGE